LNIQRLLIAFASGVIALVVGWFAGGAARDVWGDQYEVGVGVVEVDAGVPVATASPTPEPTVAETEAATPTEEPTEEPTEAPTPTQPPTPPPPPTFTPTPTPFPTFSDND
jgi:hypothetical protein